MLKSVEISGPSKSTLRERIALTGRRIAAARKAYGLSQGELAAICNIQQSRLSQWERGKREQAAHSLAAFCDLYDVPLDFLFRGKMAGIDNHVRVRIQEILATDGVERPASRARRGA